MPNASIIDIKLGVKTYDPNGSPDKTLRELEKSLRSTNNSLGLRLAGVKYKNSMNEITTDIHGEKAYTEINTYAKLKACIF
jgi:histone deacetylase 6